VFVPDKVHVCRIAINRGAEFFAGDPARLEFYDEDRLSNKVCVGLNKPGALHRISSNRALFVTVRSRTLKRRTRDACAHRKNR
jgi:hypothetical protein